MDLAEGQHGWVAMESARDAERRVPREFVPCPACVGSEGFETARRRARFQSLVAGAELPKSSEGWTLESYRRIARDEREKVSALRAAVGFVDGDLARMTPPYRNLYLFGQYGTGKTGIAVSILKARMERGQPGVYYTLPELLERVRRTFDRPRGDASDDTETLLRKLQDIDLLVLDDIGVERPTEWVLEKLFQILDGRMRNMRETVYTSNLNFDRMKAHLGERVMERVKYQTWDVEVGGRNIRDDALGRVSNRPALGSGIAQ